MRFRALHYKPRKRGTAEATTAELYCSARLELGDRRVLVVIQHENGSYSHIEMCSEEATGLAESLLRMAKG